MSWVLLSDLCAKGSIIFATVYLARILGVVDFGIFSLGVAIANSVWPIVDLGTNGYGTRQVAQHKEQARALLASLNSMRFFTALLVLAVAWFVLDAMDLEEAKRWAIFVSLFYLPSYALCPDWVVRGLEEMPLLFIINCVSALSFVVAILLFVSGSDQLVLASFIRAISFFLGSCAGVFVLYKRRQVLFSFSLKVKGWIEAVRNTYSFLLNRIATNLGQNLSLFLITYLLLDADIGMFSAPHRLYIVAIGGLAAITSAIYPVLSSLYRHEPEKFSAYQHQLVHYLLILFLPVAGVGYLAADEIILLVFGAEYAASSTTLLLMMIALPIVAMRTIFMFTLLAGGLEKRTYPIMSSSVVIQGVAAVAGVHLYGIAGAAMAIIVSELLASAWMAAIAVRKVGVKSPINAGCMVLLAVNIALVLMAELLNWQLLLILLLGIPVYLFLLALCRQIPVGKLLEIVRRRGSKAV